MRNTSETVLDNYDNLISNLKTLNGHGDDLKDCVKAAKLELIGSIMKTYENGGIKQTPDDFDRLYDLNIDLLHREEIIAHDKVYYNKH